MQVLKVFVFLEVLVAPLTSAMIYQDLELDAIVFDENPDGNLELKETAGQVYPTKKVSFRDANPHDLSVRVSPSLSNHIITELFGARDNCGGIGLPELRVVGGEEAIPGQFTYTVALLRNYSSYGIRFIAGGSLIAKQWVLTAAHNLLGYKYQPESTETLVLYVGAHNVSSPTEPHRQTFTVKKAFIHKDYNGTTKVNDIALIELDKPVILGERVQPVCLSNSDPEPEQKAVLSGWGKMGESLPPSDVLQTVNLSLAENDKCQQLYSNNLLSATAPAITETMICAGSSSPMKDACTGDSGGPLVIFNGNGKPLQVGIVSWGAGCGRYPGVYTRVNPYLNWIDRIMTRRYLN